MQDEQAPADLIAANERLQAAARDAAEKRARELPRAADVTELVQRMAAELGSVSEDVVRQHDRRLQADARRARLVSSGIVAELPDEDVELILEGREQPLHPMVTVRRWLKAATEVPYQQPMLVLCGGTGTGKTVAAAWALSMRGGLYVSIETFAREYRRYLRDASVADAAARALDRYWSAPLVALDELGDEPEDRETMELVRVALRRLTDRRQSRGRTLTIVCTNLLAHELADRFRIGRYDERTWSRWERMAAIRSVKGDDQRRRR